MTYEELVRIGPNNLTQTQKRYVCGRCAAYRRMIGISQADMAKRLGISRAWLNQHENCVIYAPRIVYGLMGFLDFKEVFYHGATND